MKWWSFGLRICFVTRSIRSYNSRIISFSVFTQLFLRGKPYLQKYMRRLPKTHKKLPMKKNDEPDFYGMDKANPLPTMEDVPLAPTNGFSANGMPLSSKPSGMSVSMGRGMQGPSSPSNYQGMNGLTGMSSMNGMNGMGGTSAAYMEPQLLGGPPRHMGMGMGMGPSGMGGMMGASGMMGSVAPPGMMGGGMSFRESQFGGNMSSPMGGHMSGMGMTSGMGMSPGMVMSPAMGMSPGMGMSSGLGMSPGMGMTMGGMGFRESQFGAGEMGMGGPGMGGMGGGMNPGMYGGGASAAGDMAEYQRLRQIQQMHMLDRSHMAGPVRRF